MEPNFEDRQYPIVNELGYKKTQLNVGGTSLLDVEPYKELQRGDVVVSVIPKIRASFS